MIAFFATRPFRFAKQFRIKVSPAATAGNQARLAELGAAGAADDTSHRLAAAYAGRKNGAVVDFPIAENAPREGERFQGKVFLLIDRQSYSNTANVAALVQDYGFGTLLGEETSDLATTYGAMEQFTLPRTGIAVGFPKALIVRPSGNLGARGVVPDVPIPSPPVPGPNDAMLEEALAIVRRSP
jgi:C-terminal processing protease CtpA/Prc